MEQEVIASGQPLVNILLNIAGGIIVVIFDRTVIWAFKKYTGCTFKKIFGKHTANFKIIYGELFRANDTSQFPFEKPGSGYIFRSSSVIPFSDSRAASYIAFAFHKFTKKSPILLSDESCNSTINFSYCSVGGRNNNKSTDIIESQLNRFITFGTEAITFKSNDSFNYISNYEIDYCAIIKITEGSNTKICIAGLGEWGTSGGAWYIANKWRELQKIVNNKDFGAVIQVRTKIDDSAKLMSVIYGNNLIINEV